MGFTEFDISQRTRSKNDRSRPLRDDFIVNVSVINPNCNWCTAKSESINERNMFSKISKILLSVSGQQKRGRGGVNEATEVGRRYYV